MVTRAAPSANTSRYGQASIYFLLAGLSVTFIVVSLFDVISFADLSNVPLEEPAGAPFSTSGAVTVLHWTDWFDNHLYAADTVRSCPRRDREGEVTCTITSDRSALNRAEAVVFHARNIELKKMPPSRASPSQIWIYWSEENPLYDHRACGWYYRVKWWERQCDKVSLHAERLALFNLRMGYQTDSDIVAPYIRNSMKRFTDQPMAPLAGKKNAVVWVANNCNSLNKREKYIAALMKHYPVHSYGDCMRNVPGKESFVSEEETLKIVQQYKFAFAWENANCKDYVTEKLERVFQAGVLPIVDGPDDYSAFVPNNHSVIRVADFAGPKALADFLRRLEQDDELYLRYFDYKPPASNYDPAFLAYNADNDSECQLCRAVVEEAERLKRGGSQRVVQLDDSCKRRWWDREFYDDGTMAARPTERWIEEWGFGGEDLVIWAVLGGTVFLLLLLLRARSRILKSRMLSSFCKS